MSRKRVVITGMGAVTPVGNDVECTWEALVSGRSGVGPLTTFDASTYPVRIGAMVKDFDVRRYLTDDHLADRLSRAAAFGVGAGLQALGDAGLDRAAYAPEEQGIALGFNGIRMELPEYVEMARELVGPGGRRRYDMTRAQVERYDHDLARHALALWAGFRGPMMTVGTACSASAHAIGEAFRTIQEGDARLMLVGGYDSLTGWMDILGFSLLGALTSEFNDDPEHASRPFDARRSGFVIGEGAVMFVLEERAAAEERNARIYGELAGYASTLNAYRITDSPPDGGGAIQAIARALHESGLSPSDIDLVAAHGTGTHGNDISETVALKAVFGDDARRLAVTSVKSMTGHLTAGAGALNLLVALLAMRDGVVPPTINLCHSDPQLDLNYVALTKQKRAVRAALVNAFAFGGTNAAIVVRSFPTAEASRSNRGSAS